VNVALDYDRRQRQRGILIGVALMFFAPLGVCFFLYYGHAWHPGGQVNNGELIQPPRYLPQALPAPHALQHKWTMLYVQRGPCEELCLRRLYDTRQVRTALDRDMDRVQRVLIADAGCCNMQKLHEMHPDLITVPAGPAVEPLLALLPAANSRRVYLVDPLGNVMMFYEADARAKGMLEDLKRLLRLSQIG
jgi:hypothetical protein